MVVSLPSPATPHGAICRATRRVGRRGRVRNGNSPYRGPTCQATERTAAVVAKPADSLLIRCAIGVPHMFRSIQTAFAALAGPCTLAVIAALLLYAMVSGMRSQALVEERTRSLIDRSEAHTSELPSLMRISYAVF